MLNRFSRSTLVGAAVLAALSGGKVLAQEAQLEEIVVTARQRAERIEDVPATAGLYGPRNPSGRH